MKLKVLQHIFHNELDSLYGKDEVDSFFFILMEEFLNMNRLALSLQTNFIISKEEESLFFEALSKLKFEQPIQYILGKTEFFGLPFKVNEHTLIPRPETEELVGFVIKSLPSLSLESNSLKILDIGTGSGCIAISIAKSVTNAEVIAMDISQQALKVARENALMNDVNITFIESDILNESLWDSKFKDFEFDVIVSNPPYVRQLEKSEMNKNVLNNEPHLALFVDDEDPLVFYRAIAKCASQYLKRAGQLYFEINQYLGVEMIDLLDAFGFQNIDLKKDIHGNDRIIKGFKS